MIDTECSVAKGSLHKFLKLKEEGLRIYSDSCLPQSILYIAVPQTVDEGVKHRNHHCEEYRQHLVLFSR